MTPKKRFWIAAVFLVILAASSFVEYWQNRTAIQSGDEAAENQLQNYATASDTCVISEHQGVRDEHFSDYAVSDALMVFSYRVGSMIDVYDHGGEFQYAILLPDANNGSVVVRCVGNQIYACAKDNTVYIIENGSVIEQLSDEKAEEYTYTWFQDQPDTQIEKEYVYWLDENGERIDQVETPQIIQNNWPLGSN